MKRSDMIGDFLELSGVEKQRFSINWVSSAEPDRFVEAVTKMVNTVKKLGPLNKKEEA